MGNVQYVLRCSPCFIILMIFFLHRSVTNNGTYLIVMISTLSNEKILDYSIRRQNLSFEWIREGSQTQGTVLVAVRYSSSPFAQGLSITCNALAAATGRSLWNHPCMYRAFTIDPVDLSISVVLVCFLWNCRGDMKKTNDMISRLVSANALLSQQMRLILRQRHRSYLHSTLVCFTIVSRCTCFDTLHISILGIPASICAVMGVICVSKYISLPLLGVSLTLWLDQCLPKHPYFPFFLLHA